MAGVPQIDGYSDLERVAAGGFGVVYRARQDRHDRVVALKVLNVGDLDERARLRFERECRAMGSLSWHPNVVALHDSGIAGDGHPYLSMEFLEGGSLGDRLHHGPMGWPDAVIAGVQIAGALGAAHEAGTLHRDLKPENLLVGPFGEIMLGDFGIAAVEGSARTTVGHASFTIGHAAPEVLQGERPDERSDLYSLASTLYTLISGSLPFPQGRDEPLATVIARVVHLPADRLQGVPVALADLITCGLAKEPVARPQTAAAFGRALQRIQAASGYPVTDLRLAPTSSVAPVVPAPPPAPPRPPAPPPPRPPATPVPTPSVVAIPLGRKQSPTAAVVIGVVVVLALLAGVAALLLTRDGGPGRGGTPAASTVAAGGQAPSLVDAIPVGTDPEQVAVTDDAVWVTNSADGTVSRVDPATNEVTEDIAVGSGPFGIATTDDAVWVTNADDGTVSRIDATSREVTATIRVGSTPGGIAATDDAVWVTIGGENRVTRIDPANDDVVDTVTVGTGPIAMATTDDAVWVTNIGDGTVTRIDPATNAQVATINVGNSPIGVSATDDAVWVANFANNTVNHIDPETNEVTATIAVGTNPTGVAAIGGAVWVTNQFDSTLSRIDAATDEVTDTITVGASPNGVDALGNDVWLTNFNPDTVTRVDAG